MADPDRGAPAVPVTGSGGTTGRAPEAWVLLVLCGLGAETAQDLLRAHPGPGLGAATLTVLAVLLSVLVAQVRLRRSVPLLAWTAVVLVSLAATVLAVDVTDGLGLPLQLSTAVFAVALAVALTVWLALEEPGVCGTVTTTGREVLYWSTALVALLLGTVAGDLLAAQLALGHDLAGAVAAGLLVLVVLARRRLRVEPVVTFWAAYVLTRPVGAALAELLARPWTREGLGLGLLRTGLLALAGALALGVWHPPRRPGGVRPVRPPGG